MTTTNLTSDEREPTITTGGESLSIFEIMQRYRNDGSCEHVIEDALRRLSLIDSQAALRPTGWQTAQVTFDNPRAVKVVFETPACAEAFIDRIEPADGPIIAATRMRDKCVAKVRAIRQRYRDQAKEADTDDSQLDHFVLLHRATVASEILLEIESLTLDQTEGSSD